MDNRGIFIILLFLIVILILIYIVSDYPSKFKGKIYPIHQTFYWINLDQCHQRRENMELLFKQHDINHVRVSAIQGIDEYSKNRACTQSHRKAITTFLESKEPVGIICEDDLTMEYQKYWRCSLDDVIRKAPEDWECIQLAVITNFLSFHLFFKSGSALYKPYHPEMFSALCYIINRKGAKKLIKHPIQEWLLIPYITENWIYQNCKTYTFRYPMFTYPTNNDSNIHPSHLRGHELSKNRITYYLKHN